MTPIEQLRLADLPSQVFPLLKHMLYPGWPGNAYGDGIEGGLLRGNPSGRTIIDVGLDKCEFVVWAVNRGFIVHGFDPRRGSMADCKRKLPRGRFFRVPIRESVDGTTPLVGERPQVPPPLPVLTNHTNSSKMYPADGFAFLYETALGDVANYSMISVDGAFSSLVRWGPRSRLRVPVMRLDSVGIAEDIWLLKMDVEGYESHVLAGAKALFENRVVAHVITEYNPSLLHEAGVPTTDSTAVPTTDSTAVAQPGGDTSTGRGRGESQGREAAGLIRMLKGYGVFCFDVRGPEAPWSLSRDRPSAATEHAAEFERNAKLERRKLQPDWWHYAGAFDDLLCVNIAKSWTHTPRPRTTAEGWAPFSRCGEGRVRPRCGSD